MVSKTSLLPLVRSFDWEAVAGSLQERPSLVAHRDERGRNWLHICCATALKGRDARPSIRTADVLLARGIDLNDHAFTEGRWRATPVWFCVSFGRNLRLAEYLLKLGASPHTRFTLPPTIATPRQSVCSCDTEQISRSLPDVAKPRCWVPLGGVTSRRLKPCSNAVRT